MAPLIPAAALHASYSLAPAAGQLGYPLPRYCVPANTLHAQNVTRRSFDTTYRLNAYVNLGWHRGYGRKRVLIDVSAEGAQPRRSSLDCAPTCAASRMAAR